MFTLGVCCTFCQQEFHFKSDSKILRLALELADFADDVKNHTKKCAAIFKGLNAAGQHYYKLSTTTVTHQDLSVKERAYGL